MPKTETILTRVDSELKAKIEAIAQRTERSISHVAAQALEDYVDVYDWQVALIERRLAEARAGAPVVPHEEVAAWLDSKGTDNELPRPRGKPRS